VFREVYEEICLAVRNGAQLDEPAPPALPEKAPPPLDKTRNQEKLQALRTSLKL
jgi:hypothetical protein